MSTYARERVYQLDWGVVLALGLALLAAAPFLTRPGLPRETDAELHVYRAAELGHTLRAGVLYSRWAPDLYLGYGYPIFNYYAPLSYYLANLFDLVPGVDIVTGVKAVFVLGFLLASLGSYWLGSDLFGRAAGVVAAASFTFAPYVVLIDPHARGDLAEHFAICLLPMAFFTFRRLMAGTGRRGALPGSVLSLAALVTSHNLLGMIGVALLFLYWLWEVIGDAKWNRAGWGMLAFLLAGAITAFFWLPMIFELGAVELTVTGPGHFDYREHFVSLGELLAPSRILDLGATAPRYRFNLGLAQWLMAAGVLGALLRRPKRAELWYFFLAALGLAFLMTPMSRWVWEVVPAMAYLQFPWRLLGPANLMLAVCAAGSTTLLAAKRWQGPALASVIGLTLLLALPVLYPPMWAPDFGGTTPEDIIRWELHGGALGTTSTGDFVPKGAARVRMRPVATLIDSYSGPGPVDKVNRATVPDGAEVDIVEHGPLHDRLSVSTPHGFLLRLYTFYFPGWRAYVDGEEADIEVARPEGFITVWVPAGQHEVLVRFSDTPPRTAGWIISALGLVVLALGTGLMRGSQVRRQGPGGSAQSMAWIGAVLLLFVAVKNRVIDPHDNWLRYTSPPGQAWPAENKLSANFGDQIQLLGYDLPKQHVRSGETFPLILYWRALRPLEVNYQSFVHVARPLHILWGQEDHLNPGGLPTERWPVDKYVWDEYEIKVLPGTPPGEYLLNVGLYSMKGGYRLQRTDDEQGQAVGDSLVLAGPKVDPPRRQPALGELGLTEAVTVTFPDVGITLLGYYQPVQKVTLPACWRVTLFWRADRDHPGAQERDLILLDADGGEVWRSAGDPADYPFAIWKAGEIVRDPVVFVPAQVPAVKSGWYDFGVAVRAGEPSTAGDLGERFVRLGRVKFKAESKE